MSQNGQHIDIKEAESSLQSMNLNQDGDANHSSKTDKQKVDILLKPTGNAPIMKKKKWQVESDKPIGWIVEFIKKYLKLEANEKLFLYVNQSFAPSPDQIVKNLYDCYSTEGKLVLHYCKTQAWG
ncbi:autophagy-related 12 [Rhynchophorus ferrugineus]|uniref:autophagy-related 12 n=1 Tax=Rhynchophorus ferrugineus TaxID=354439 RepID=UPI003FCCCAC8